MMAGSLDGTSVTVLSQDDYHYLIIRSDCFYLKFSPKTEMDRAQVIVELRSVADALERDADG